VFFESSIQTAYTGLINPADNAFSNGAGKSKKKLKNYYAVPIACKWRHRE